MHSVWRYPGVYQKRVWGKRPRGSWHEAPHPNPLPEGRAPSADAVAGGGDKAPSHLYTAKFCSDTLSNTVCCTAGGSAAMLLVRQVSTVPPKTPCSLMNASSSEAALAVNSRAMAWVATAVCGYFRSTKANARAILSMG